MQTALTMLVDITVLARKDLLEMVARVQVNYLYFRVINTELITGVHRAITNGFTY